MLKNYLVKIDYEMEVTAESKEEAQELFWYELHS